MFDVNKMGFPFVFLINTKRLKRRKMKVDPLVIKREGRKKKMVKRPKYPYMGITCVDLTS